MSSPLNQTPTRQRLGDFEIVRELGRGGMGIVYEAVQMSLDRRVALKVLGAGLGLTPKAVDRFRREAAAAAKLHHTNIVPVYATGEEAGQHFYAMELIAGPSLDAVIRQLRETSGAGELADGQPITTPPTPLAVTGPYVEGSSAAAGSATNLTASSLSSDSQFFDTVAKMIAEVADALHYAHQQGVIHRDIKPSNLLQSPDGRLSINDFGLARMLEQPGMTMTGEFVGTPAYMSPEQITAGRVPLDHRTDVYSLGATLYELLTLRPPFVGERRDQLLAQILQKDPKPPRRINPMVPVDLETICLKAIDKDPDRRYQHAGEMAEDLRRYVNRFAILARRAGLVERGWKWVKRHPGVTWATACAILALVAAGAFAYQAYLADQDRIAQKRESDEKLRQEQLRSALDKGLLAGMSGDFDDADKAIAQAQSLDAPEGQIRLLRGFVAFHRGDRSKAAEHAKVAVELMPESVAALMLLACVDGWRDDAAGLSNSLTKADTLAMKTPEDYLFRAMAVGVSEPARGLQWLDLSGPLLTTPVGRQMRAELQHDLADDTAKVADALQAVRDAVVAEQLLPNHLYSLTTHVRAQVTLAYAYQKAGDAQRCQETLRQVKPEIDRIRKDEEGRGDVALMRYHLLMDDQEAAFLVIRDRYTTRGTARFHYAAGLYERGQSQEALAILQPANTRHDILLACLRAELNGPEEGRRVFETLSSLSDRRAGVGALYYQTILRLLGKKQEAEAFSRTLRDETPTRERRQGWWQDLLDYSCGTLAADQLLAKAGASHFNLLHAHYFIGVTCLADGDRPAAMAHFAKALDNAYVVSPDHILSRAFLGRLRADPKWPKWIPLKE